MRSFKIIAATFAIASLVALGACKKDDKKKTDDKGDKGGTGDEAKKPTDDTAPNPCAGKNPCGAAAGKMTLDQKKDMANKMVAMMTEVAKVVEANADDCGKMAEGINGIADKNKDFIESMKKAMADNEPDPEFDKWFEATHKENMTKSMGGAMGAMQKKCKDDQGVKDAMQKVLPTG